MAHEYFVKQFEHCHRCSPLQGIGDEAYLTEFTEEEEVGNVYPGYIGFARIEKDIVTIQIVTRRRTVVPELLRRTRPMAPMTGPCRGCEAAWERLAALGAC